MLFKGTAVHYNMESHGADTNCTEVFPVVNVYFERK